jgi:hypothetical protein
MKNTEKAALAYLVSFAGATAFNYWRGHRGMDLVTRTATDGIIVGTGVSVIAILASELEPGTRSTPMMSAYAPQLTARENGSELAKHNGESFKGMGSLSAEAINFLGRVNPEAVAKTVKAAGLVIGKVPSNPYVTDIDAVE